MVPIVGFQELVEDCRYVPKIGRDGWTVAHTHTQCDQQKTEKIGGLHASQFSFEMIARERGNHLVDCCSLLSSFSAWSAREIIEARLLESSDAANHFYKLLQQTWMMRKEEEGRERERRFIYKRRGTEIVYHRNLFTPMKPHAAFSAMMIKRREILCLRLLDRILLGNGRQNRSSNLDDGATTTTKV